MKARVRIVSDQNIESPREWSNVGTMVCWHRKYNLGDEQPKEPPEDWIRFLAHEKVQADSDDCIPQKHIDRIIEKYYVMLPLYLYDHSGITMRCSSFHCMWDSGQVGWIYCTKEKACKEYGENAFKATEYLEGEVKVYDQYLRGDVYGFIVEEYNEVTDPDAHYAEHIDSCYGFYGSDIKTNGMLDHISEKYHELALEAELEYA